MSPVNAKFLGQLRSGDQVNLEPALRAGDALGGHLVSGHVDGLAEVLSVQGDARSQRVRFRVPAALSRYVARKGSVAIDGVSLTVNEVEGDVFGVNLIPHTWEVTTLGTLAPERLKNASGLFNLARMPATSGNQVELLIDGQQTFDSILAGLESAQKYIFFQFYII